MYPRHRFHAPLSVPCSSHLPMRCRSLPLSRASRPRLSAGCPERRSRRAPAPHLPPPGRAGVAARVPPALSGAGQRFSPPGDTAGTPRSPGSPRRDPLRGSPRPGVPYLPCGRRGAERCSAARGGRAAGRAPIAAAYRRCLSPSWAPFPGSRGSGALVCCWMSMAPSRSLPPSLPPSDPPHPGRGAGKVQRCSSTCRACGRGPDPPLFITEHPRRPLARFSCFTPGPTAPQGNDKPGTHGPAPLLIPPFPCSPQLLLLHFFPGIFSCAQIRSLPIFPIHCSLLFPYPALSSPSLLRLPPPTSFSLSLIIIFLLLPPPFLYPTLPHVFCNLPCH